MALSEQPPLPGMRVLVHGLQRQAHLNGHIGMILGDSDNGRYALRIEGSGKAVSIKPSNFTCIKPSNELPIGIGDDGPAFDTSKMLRGDCVMCLGEGRATRALVPCGHLCVCAECADDVLKHRRCPVCRHFITSLLQVFVPGGARDPELEKAIERAKKAENQVAELTKRLNHKRSWVTDDTPLADDDPLWDKPFKSLFRDGEPQKKRKKEKKHKKAKSRKSS